jgi:hypothetical protein
MNPRRNCAEGKRQRAPRKASWLGFTLMEVLIASTLFFVGSFTILNLVGQGLRGLRAMQIQDQAPTPSDVFSRIIFTNKLVESSMEGDFGEIYPNFTWSMEIYFAPGATNALFQVDATIYKEGKEDSRASTFLYHPSKLSLRILARRASRRLRSWN